ncbi:MAG TPA: ATP synthase F0 subunit C [Firmicutes bacterium]|nr:ATP synthase F0 subunit C [Bacillota bacterium]HHY98406.1 ATP synthase F0 subunit C [Bacillota bacterium]
MTSAVILKLASILAACLIVSVAAIAAGFGDAQVAGKAVEGIARQPEAKSSIFSTMLIGIGLVEATPIIALVVALILLYANPLLG